MIRWLLLLLFAGLLIIPDHADAQLNRRKIKKSNKRISKYKGNKREFTKQKQYQYLGFSVNAINYFGDITPTSSFASTDISFTRPGFSIFGAHRFETRFTLEGAFSWGTLAGDDFTSAKPSGESVYRYIRNLSFRNRIYELSAVLVADLFANEASYLSRLQWSPYGFIGIAGLYHNPKARVNENSSLPEAGQWVALQPLGTEGQQSGQYNNSPYSRFQFAIPFGIGIRYRLNQLIDLSFQFGMRFLFTDYLDDVSGGYVDLGVFGNDELARALSDRSRELTSAKNNEPRDTDAIASNSRPQTYTSVFDGNDYTVLAGYGSDTDPGNIRGNINNDDLYLFTQIRIAYIISGSFRRAKYR